MQFHELSDEDLVSRLQNLCGEARRIDVSVIELLIEVEERRLDLRSACSSLFDFCTRRLGLSDSAALRRITIARMAKRFPTLLGHLASGKVHMSSLAVLREHLTEANVEQMIDAIAKKSRREVEDLVGTWAPRADAATIRELPQAEIAAPSMPAEPALLGELGEATSPFPPLRSEVTEEARYRLQMTASAALKEKLTRARDLMRHSNPSGDLAVVVERALDALLEKLEKRRLGKATRPHRRRRHSKPGHVPSEVRREVFERDGEQCSFVDEQGRRCPSRGFLEIDHVQSRALGGSDEPANLRLLCRPHNRLHAEDDFTREHVERQIHLRQRRRRRTPSPTCSPAESCSSSPAESSSSVPAESCSSSPPGASRAPSPTDAEVERAKRGLVNLGFGAKEASRALAAVLAGHPNGIPLPEILREALRVLTS